MTAGVGNVSKSILRLSGADHGSAMLEQPAAQAYVLKFLAR